MGPPGRQCRAVHLGIKEVEAFIHQLSCGGVQGCSQERVLTPWPFRPALDAGRAPAAGVSARHVGCTLLIPSLLTLVSFGYLRGSL